MIFKENVDQRTLMLIKIKHSDKKENPKQKVLFL